MAGAREAQQEAQTAAAAQRQPAVDRPPGKCHFFLATKRRHCKFDTVPGQRFCGNHLFEGVGTGPARVPCPWDPGHTVLESELERHMPKCPRYLQQLAKQQQAFFAEDINAGPGPEVEWPAGLQPLVQQQPAENGALAAAGAGTAAVGTAAEDGGQRMQQGRTAQRPALMQAAYAAAIGEHRFQQLLCRIEAACEQIWEEEALCLCVPPEAEPFLLPSSATDNRPFSLKHAQQQASIVGNMQQRGLLQGAQAVTYVEYGAGKGYLGHMLSLCCPEARKIVMMDVRGFKDKADRAMRHLELQRLRCDIKDFDVARVKGVEGGGAWVALGKHLCGAATDFTLRSCMRQLQAQLQEQQGEQQQQQQRLEEDDVQEEEEEQQEGEQHQQQPDTRHHSQAAAGGRVSGVRGLAVATCCHHRCTWRHFVAQDVMQGLGFSPQEFEVIVWMTGWALCGHEAPAGFGGSDCEGEGAEPMQGEQQRQHKQRSHKRGQEEYSPPASPPPPAAMAATLPADRGEGTAATVPPRQQEAGMPGAAAGNDEWRPQWALARGEKIAVGRRCKQLIDAARLCWLRQQGFEASLVKYVPSIVSGENRLLLATARDAEQQL